MSTTIEPREKKTPESRISRTEFVQRAARRAKLPVRTMQAAYDALTEEIIDLVKAKNRVTLTGFGRFYQQPHKGHLAQASPGEKGSSTTRVPDYVVLKFSATRDANRRLSMTDEEAAAELLQKRRPAQRKSAAAGGQED